MDAGGGQRNSQKPGSNIRFPGRDFNQRVSENEP